MWAASYHPMEGRVVKAPAALTASTAITAGLSMSAVPLEKLDTLANTRDPGVEH